MALTLFGLTTWMAAAIADFVESYGSKSGISVRNETVVRFGSLSRLGHSSGAKAVTKGLQTAILAA